MLVELGLLVTGFSVITADADSDKDLTTMAAWDGLAIVYLLLGLFGMWLTARQVPAPVGNPQGSASAEATAPVDEDVDLVAISQAKRSPFLRRFLGLYWGLLPVVFSLLGLSAALSVVFLNPAADGLVADTTKAVGAVAMVLAWLLLHVSYARRYQWFYRRDGGLEFPGNTQEPGEVDFLYFATTLGSSFATSDVNVTTTRMRWHVLVHSVLSFFYNAIVLAVAFRILTGG